MVAVSNASKAPTVVVLVGVGRVVVVMDVAVAGTVKFVEAVLQAIVEAAVLVILIVCKRGMVTEKERTRAGEGQTSVNVANTFCIASDLTSFFKVMMSLFNALLSAFFNHFLHAKSTSSSDLNVVTTSRE